MYFSSFILSYNFLILHFHTFTHGLTRPRPCTQVGRILPIKRDNSPDFFPGRLRTSMPFGYHNLPDSCPLSFRWCRYRAHYRLYCIRLLTYNLQQRLLTYTAQQLLLTDSLQDAISKHNVYDTTPKHSLQETFFSSTTSMTPLRNRISTSQRSGHDLPNTTSNT